MMRLFQTLIAGLLVSFIGSTAHATVLTINSDGDDGLANASSTACDTGSTVTIPGAGTLPECTLRAAIEAANNGSGTIDIEYATALDCADLSQIRLDSQLPAITSSVHIHSDTHPCAGNGASYYPVIAADDPFSLPYGLLITGSDVVIERLGFVGFTIAAIHVLGGAENVIIDEVQASLNPGRGIVIWNAVNVTVTGSSFTFNTLDNVYVESTDGFSLMDNTITNSNDASGVRVLGGSTGAVGSITGLPPNRVCRGNQISGNERAGVWVRTGSQVSVRCNTISGNGESGIYLDSDDNLVGSSAEPGELVLLPSGGNTIRDNDAHGVYITEDSEGNTIGRNTIGGTDTNPGQGNAGSGIHVEGGVTWIHSNSVSYNATGISVANEGRAIIRGNAIMSNDGNGITSTRNLVRVGGEDAADANVIGLNGNAGIWYESPGGAGFPSVAGNYIGTNADGDDLGNGNAGIMVRNTSTTAYIGQLAITGNPTVPNVIGFNDTGVFIHHSEDARITNNYIGTNADGDDLGNSNVGVAIAMTQNSRVGTTAAVAILPPIESSGNIIANNGTGVQVSGAGVASINNPIRGNSFHGNGQGINLVGGGDEVDPGGGASGPNNLQNFPEFDLDATFYDEGSDTVEYSYRVRTNTDNAAYPLRVDFYLADGTSAQGRIWIGSDSYPASSANAYRIGSFTPAVSISGSDHLVATATDADGNTSQFTPDVIALGEGNGGEPGDNEIFVDRFEQ